jgi:hypothetical protein
MAGAARRRENVRIFGTLYIFSWGVRLDRNRRVIGVLGGDLAMGYDGISN